jgi:tRNA pseudouridine55 synthase
VSRRKRRRRRPSSKTGPGAVGVLLVDKPSGVTSHDIVDRLRWFTGQRRIGHAGTLDPLATGLLTLLIGEATKLSPWVTADDKEYETIARLGVRTDTLDAEGEPLDHTDLSEDLDRVAVERALQQYRGTFEQQVPRYSAVWVEGKRLHERTRAGEQVTIPTRRVTIHELELTAFTLPELTLRVVCSKGTYIRQLVADLGDALGCGAHVRSLRRLRVGRHHVDQAVALDTLTDPAQLEEHLLSPRDYVAHTMPCVELNADGALRTRQGQFLPWTELDRDPLPADTVFALLQGPELVAVAVAEECAERAYHLARVFVPAPAPAEAPEEPADQQ